MIDAAMKGFGKIPSENNQLDTSWYVSGAGLFRLKVLLSIELTSDHCTVLSFKPDNGVKIRSASLRLLGSYNHNVA